MRARLLDTALEMLEGSGPEALQARKLTAEIGTSTQAVYTHFGGMPGLFEAIVAEGFVRFADHVAAVPESDDPVADFMAKGGAYCVWALTHPQLYRLMFGLTGGGLRVHAGLEMTVTGTLANFPEGQAALEVLVRSLDRVKDSGRIRPEDSVVAAGQFLSATHGWVLLEIAHAFGAEGDGGQVIKPLAINLMVGLGDGREAAERSWRAALGGPADTGS
ncbi:MAG: TetR/AcrR family transcriptional regulator [Actinomycetota bacterium]|nr:TetR/AcrR family transcriptional regulator [Actinomycetota bacterium]